ncbi:hypothetical protein C9374_004262 [Naegleria lovaniensis]|uniref:CDP-alcohol phosphatidyltransferase n=1 Tax=Naegleria lovaniensis TaxID=51637 RepID=A0AA88GQR0_NAELO|nr:uncharacterized protein C9374_004262 [Naegleria lovaniensis]KAG2383591.1 hypothetical protein C9374_004262 [Naegleria lovaniensis]
MQSLGSTNRNGQIDQATQLGHSSSIGTTTRLSLYDRLTNYPYLTEAAKISLRDYKYKSGDASILSYYLQPYWEFCAKLIPHYVAPNTITLLGFLGVLFGWAVLVYYNPDLHNHQVPSIIYLLNALLLFYYQTMDAIDGKHARNTKNSSALGELFDHGLDALIGYFQCYILVSAIDLGSTYFALIVIVLYYMTSFMMIWEDYVTDEMRFGKYNSPTEAIMLAITILISSFAMGQSKWSTVLFTVQRNDSARKRSHRTIHVIGGIGGALKGILSYMIVLIMFGMLAYLSPHLVENHFLPFSMLYGLTASYIQTRLIFARVCGCLSPTFFFIMIPMCILLVWRVVVFMLNASNHLWQVRMEVYLLYACVATVIASYLHMACLVIRQICETLGIHAFRVKKHVLADDRVCLCQSSQQEATTSPFAPSDYARRRDKDLSLKTSDILFARANSTPPTRFTNKEDLSFLTVDQPATLIPKQKLAAERKRNATIRNPLNCDDINHPEDYGDFAVRGFFRSDYQRVIPEKHKTDKLNVKDINDEWKFTTRRNINPLSPRYDYEKRIIGRDIGEIEGSKPAPLPPLSNYIKEPLVERRGNFGHAVPNTFPVERREYRKINFVQDIIGEPPKHYATFHVNTRRQTHPLDPKY